MTYSPMVIKIARIIEHRYGPYASDPNNPYQWVQWVAQHPTVLHMRVELNTMTGHVRMPP